MFIPLHVKSDYSLAYGTAAIDVLVERAAILGYRALALTDLETLAGQVHFQTQCLKYGLKPITGIELREGFDSRREFGRKTGRLLLLAASRAGYSNLCRIVNQRRGASRGGGKHLPLDNDLCTLVAGRASGLFALSDDPSVLEKLLAGGSFPSGRLGLLIIRPGDPAVEASRRESIKRLGVGAVADIDAIFLEKSDLALHMLQVAVRQGKLIANLAGSAEVESAERWLRGPTEAAALFADSPEAVRAALAIADECQFYFWDLRPQQPAVELSGTEQTQDRLRRLCWEAVTARSQESSPWTSEHADRLEEELEMFERLGLSGLMLIVREIIAYSRGRGIPVVARGSAVSSLVLHLLGASPLDPLEHGLLFERFLHPGKSQWPDIDLDLPWHCRNEVIDWVYHHFGKDRVAMVAAYHTFQRRSALREGLKAFGFKPAEIEKFSRALPPDDLAVEEVDFLGLADLAEDDTPPGEIIGIGQRNPGLTEILPLVQRLVGHPHHVATHPGGVIIGRTSLEEMLPLERAPKGVVITQYDMAALAELGIVKIDLLGNRCLSELEETLRLSGNLEPSRLEKIAPDDPKAMALINRAETIGCFQLESPAMRSLLAALPIQRESDLIAALALIRPGTAAGRAKAAFVRRARGDETDLPPDYPEVADRLSETHGMLLYEEDIMVLLARVGGLTLGEADELRAAIVRSSGNPGVLATLAEAFLGSSDAASVSEDATRTRAWSAATRFAAYSFNKAHAASYARLAYLAAYMKVHYPVEFACALLNHHQGMYPLRTIASELIRNGVVLQPPHINVSNYQAMVCRHNEKAKVCVGLDKLKGLSNRSLEKLLLERERNGSFTTLTDLWRRVRLSGRELEALILSGACDELAPLFAVDYPFIHEAVLEILRKEGNVGEIEKIRVEPRAKTPREQGQLALYMSLVRVRKELRYFEMHLSAHPIALLRTEAGKYDCITIGAIAGLQTGSRVRIAAIAAAMRRVPTTRGIMQFITFEDETGIIEAVVLPPQFRILGDQISTPGPFLVSGMVRRQQGAVHLEVHELEPFYKRRQPFSGKGF